MSLQELVVVTGVLVQPRLLQERLYLTLVVAVEEIQLLLLELVVLAVVAMEVQEVMVEEELQTLEVVVEVVGLPLREHYMREEQVVPA